MKNLICVALVAIAMCLIFTGCQGVPFLHQHDWQDATCTTPKTCATCNETEGEALGHTASSEATCSAPQTCTVCNTELAAVKKHNFVDGICSVCGNQIKNMPTTTLELMNPYGITGEWANETGTQTYEFAEGVTVILSGKARLTATQAQLYPDACCDFVFPGLVSKITFMGTADRDTRIFVSTDGGENWITVKRVNSGESTTVDLMGAYQYVRIANRSGSQNKLITIIVNPAE